MTRVLTSHLHIDSCQRPMLIRVVLAASSSCQTSQEAVDIFCGSGQQILRWLAYAACTRLAQKHGKTMGCFVPQSVVKEGTVLDVDLVLSEVAEDGDVLTVEYSPGPLAFTTRWEQRPKSPPLLWGVMDDAGAAEASSTAWLEEWDLHAEGLAALAVASAQLPQQPHQQGQHAASPSPAQTSSSQDVAQDEHQPAVQQLQDAEATAVSPSHHQQHLASGQKLPQDADGTSNADVARVRAVMVQHAGALQMLFLLFSTDPCSPVDTATRMGLPQFKALLQAAKVTSSSVPPERVDELYMVLQSSQGTMARKGQSQHSNSMDFADFLVLLVHVAHHRFAGESFLTGGSTQLSTKLLSLLQDCICTHLYPELQRRLDKLAKASATPASKALLKKGRRLTEQVLERCQIRRVRTQGVLQVPYTYVLRHLERWGLLGKEFTLQELLPVVVFAKQEATDPYRFVLQPQPLALDYDEFEKLLLGVAALMARVRKRPDAVDEVLGELLDAIYKKSGVLLTLNT